MIFEKARELEREDRSFVMVTLLSLRGSAPQIPGAKCLVTKDGLFAGTVGGGKVEARAIERAKELLLSEKKLDPVQVTWNLQRDIKMTCGGECTFLFEHFPSTQWKIAIFGAGHVAKALTKVLATLDCQISVIDSRKEWLSKIEHGKTIQATSPKEMVSLFDESTFFLSMTKGHAEDIPFLYEVFKQFPNCPYVGVIGSDSKGRAIKAELKEMGVSDTFLEKLRVPIGLKLGRNVPAEISISISSELLMARDTFYAESEVV